MSKSRSAFLAHTFFQFSDWFISGAVDGGISELFFGLLSGVVLPTLLGFAFLTGAFG
jgi:hypothetical protein